MAYNNAIVQRLRIFIFLIPDKIRPYSCNRPLAGTEDRRVSQPNLQLSLVCLRNMLKSARVDGFIKSLPVEGIPFKT